MTTSTRRATPAKKPTSIKIPARAYATAQRVARRERRTITAVVELAIENYAAFRDDDDARKRLAAGSSK